MIEDLEAMLDNPGRLRDMYDNFVYMCVNDKEGFVKEVIEWVIEREKKNE